MYKLLLLLSLTSSIMLSAQTSHYGRDLLHPLQTETVGRPICYLRLPGDIFVTEQDTTLFVIGDHKGSTRSWMRSDNNLIFAAAFDPYGKPRTLLQIPFRYNSTYIWDMASGLYSSPTRKYAPAVSRFLSTDLIGADPGSYAFVSCNPVRYSDAYGASPTDDIANQIRSSADFLALGQMSSSTRYEVLHRLTTIDRLYSTDPVYSELKNRSTQLRTAIETAGLDIAAHFSTSGDVYKALLTSGRYKDLVYQYNFANCGECSGVMAGVLHDMFPGLNVEQVFGAVAPEGLIHSGVQNPHEVMRQVNHGYNILNRNFRTDINNPDSWNQEAIAVDAWNQKVFTWPEFIVTYYEEKNTHYNFAEVHKNAFTNTYINFPGTVNFPIRDRLPATAAAPQPKTFFYDREEETYINIISAKAGRPAP